MRRISLFLPLIVVALCFTTCKIDRQNKLIGYWKEVPFTDPDSVEYLTFWTFYSGDILELRQISNIDDGTKGDTISTKSYTYTTEGKELNIFATGEDVNGNYFIGSGDIRGKYWMDELKKGKRLKIVRRKHPDGSTEAAYRRIELIKQ